MRQANCHKAVTSGQQQDTDYTFGATIKTQQSILHISKLCILIMSNVLHNSSESFPSTHTFLTANRTFSHVFHHVCFQMQINTPHLSISHQNYLIQQPSTSSCVLYFVTSRLIQTSSHTHTHTHTHASDENKCELSSLCIRNYNAITFQLLYSRHSSFQTDVMAAASAAQFRRVIRFFISRAKKRCPCDNGTASLG